MTKLSGITEVEFLALEERNLDTTCYRGSGPLAHLALISQADAFNQDKNPSGLQRDLSRTHAGEAYTYASRPRDGHRPRAFPEVVLNVRDKKDVAIEPAGFDANGRRLVKLRFTPQEGGDETTVSRVDGNHRLHYAAGDETREPVLADAPFQIHVGLSRDQERSLFVDINSNQKGLNTSHLAVMQSRLTDEEDEIKNHPDRWIAMRLAEDPTSPWHGLVHMSGGRPGTSRTQGLQRLVNLAGLQSGVKKTLSKSQYIHDFTDIKAQYAIIRNYWSAVKLVFADEWANPRDHLLLKNIGVWSLSYLSGTIIDRCVPQQKIGIHDMAFYLAQVQGRFDWSKNARTGERSVAGMSGNQAALIVAGTMAQELTDERTGNVTKNLEQLLLSEG